MKSSVFLNAITLHKKRVFIVQVERQSKRAYVKQSGTYILNNEGPVFVFKLLCMGVLQETQAEIIHSNKRGGEQKNIAVWEVCFSGHFHISDF